MGVASLVLGIVSIVFVVFTGGVARPVAAVLGIVGIVLGGLARRDNPTGIATAGLVCSIIGAVLGLIAVITCYGCIGCAGGLASMGY